MLISLDLIVIFDTKVLKVSGILMPLEQFDTSSEKTGTKPPVQCNSCAG